MRNWKNPILTVLSLAVWIALTSFGHGQPTSRLSTSFLVRGEQATLDVVIVDGQPVGLPQIPPMPNNIRIQETNIGPLTQFLPGRRLEYVYQYRIMGYDVGDYTIPPIKVNVDGVITMTQPLDFQIFNPDDLEPSEVDVGDRKIRCYSTFRTLNATPYENETTPAEIKIFVPVDLSIQDWGIPDFERDGLTAWRFQPSRQPGRVNLLGVPYYSIAYPSTITPTRTGKISIGPAKVRIMTLESVFQPFQRAINQEFYVTVPKLEMDAIKLPDGAPEGFENAVGSFQLSARTDTKEIQEGDPITVDLVVAGSGNLDTMRPPALSESDGWKVYNNITDQRNDERRDLAGRVVFHQSIRPLEMKSEIPPFRLVYFDPKTKTYKTLTTEPIALHMTPKPATAVDAAVQALPVPFERMNDVLALLRPEHLTGPSATILPSWILHAVGGFLALILIFKALWMRYAPGLRKDPDLVVRTRELQEVNRAKSAGDTNFLKAAGAFIERHLSANPSPEIHEILAERDAACFRTDKPESILTRKRRDEILRLLRNAAIVLTTLLVLQPTTSRAETQLELAAKAVEAYDSAKYQDAIKLWLDAGKYENLSAETLYNIGNACYRAGSPGYAALYYRRALVRDSGLHEARQNLRFIERKYGAITIQRPDYQYAVAKFPITSWQNTLWVGLWLCGLALLVFPATRRGARIRWVAVTALVIGPLLVSAGLLGWRYFPNDAQFAPISRQAVIIQERVALHTDAARTAPEVIDAPPGSLCEVIRESGQWAYISFATKTRGWVLRNTLEMVQPESPPEPPKFQKPKGDGKSA